MRVKLVKESLNPWDLSTHELEKIKKQIDEMTYHDMLLKWRFAKIGDILFKGEIGEYFKRIMFEKKDKLSNAEQVSISKDIGWE